MCSPARSPFQDPTPRVSPPAPGLHGSSPSALRPRRPRGPPLVSRPPPGTLAPGFPASPPPRMSWPCGLSAGHGGPGPGAGTLGREDKAVTGSPRGHALPPVSGGSDGARSRTRRGPPARAELRTSWNSALLEVLGPAPPGPLLRSALGSAVPSAPSPRPELCARWGVVTWFYTIYS